MNNEDAIKILSYYRNTFAKIGMIEHHPVWHLFVDIESEYLVMALDKAMEALKNTDEREVFDETFHII